MSAIRTDPSFGLDTATPVIFRAEVSSRSTPPLDYRWEFGDGSPPSSAQEPNHTYDRAGSYVVTLTVQNDFGADSRSERVEVRAPDSDLYFWTDTPDFGPMQVTVAGVTQQITQWYSQYPGCGRYQGVAAFVDLPRGAYTFLASSASGRTWSGSVTLTDHCHSVVLN